MLIRVLKSLCIGAVVLLPPAPELNAQANPYQTRATACRAGNLSGDSVHFTRFDSGTRRDGYLATRTLGFTAPARGISGGSIEVCAEYGSVEIADSPDDLIRVQVHFDAFGEGARDPAAEAQSIMRSTTIRVRAARSGGRLVLRVLNDSLGFSTPGGQPVLTHIRVAVPHRGSYSINATALHGAVAIRRLNLDALRFRGRVGDKLKGVPGYVGSVILDNPTVMGDADILIDGENLSLPVVGRLKVGSSARMTVQTGGDVTIAIQPHPDLAIRAIGASNASTPRILLDGAAKDTSSTQFKNILLHEGRGYAAQRLKFQLLVTSTNGSVNIASVPAATLAR